jgi:hypothetical protein
MVSDSTPSDSKVTAEVVIPAMLSLVPVKV